MDRRTKQLALEYEKLKEQKEKLRQKGWGGYAQRDALHQKAQEIVDRMNEIIRISPASNLTEMDILVHRALGLHHPLDRGNQIGLRVASSGRVFSASGGKGFRPLRTRDVSSMGRRVASDLRQSMGLNIPAVTRKGQTFYLDIDHGKAPTNVKTAGKSLRRMVRDHMPQHILGLRVASTHLGDGRWIAKVTLPPIWVKDTAR